MKVTKLIDLSQFCQSFRRRRLRVGQLTQEVKSLLDILFVLSLRRKFTSDKTQSISILSISVFSFHCLTVISLCLINVFSQKKSFFISFSQKAASLRISFLSFCMICLKPFCQILFSVDSKKKLICLIEGTWFSRVTNMNNFLNRNFNFNFLDNNFFFLLFRPISFKNIRNELILWLGVFGTDESFNSIFGFEQNHHPPFPSLYSEMVHGSFEDLYSTT